MKKWEGRHEAEILNECPMYTDWSSGPKACKEWSDHAEHCECLNLVLHIQKNASAHRPATFHDIGAQAFRELLRSPFWFARKIISHSDEAAEVAETEWGP